MQRKTWGHREVRAEPWVRQWVNRDPELAVKFSKHLSNAMWKFRHDEKEVSLFSWFTWVFLKQSIIRPILWLFIAINVYFPLKCAKSYPNVFAIIFRSKENNISVDVISICWGLSLLFQARSRTGAWRCKRPGQGLVLSWWRSLQCRMAEFFTDNSN